MVLGGVDKPVFLGGVDKLLVLSEVEMESSTFIVTGVLPSLVDSPAGKPDCDDDGSVNSLPVCSEKLSSTYKM